MSYFTKVVFTIVTIVFFQSCSNLVNSGMSEKESLLDNNRSLGFVDKEGYTLTWYDDFDGTDINSEYWTIGLMDPTTNDIVPGAAGQFLLNNHYAGYITEEDSYVSSGNLHLLNQKRNISGVSPVGEFSYTSGWIMSMHKVYANKGYWEMRAKFPTGDKVWPAFWLISEDLIWAPEWDMFEYFGYNPGAGYDAMGMHLCYDEWPNQKWLEYFLTDYDFNYDNESWHTYGFEWTEDKAVWTIDGVVFRTLYNNIGNSWPNEDMYMVINNGVKTSSPDETTVWPNDFVVDYVAYYAPNSTSSTNLVDNSGFEDGLLEPWYKWNNGQISNNSKTGNYSAEIIGSPASLEQQITVRPNREYTYGAWVNIEDSTNIVNIGVKNYGGDEVFTSTSKTGWTYLEIDFITGDSNNQATIYAYSPEGQNRIYIDDTVVNEKKYIEIPQSSISIEYVDSQEIYQDGLAENLIDGNLNTLWHTEWKDNNAPFPHEVQFDLGESFDVNQLIYTPRQSNGNGTINEYEVYVSNDTNNWGEPVAVGQLGNVYDTSDKIIKLKMKNGRYVRLLALSEYNNQYYASGAEVRFFHSLK